jgi:3-phytase
MLLRSLVTPVTAPQRAGKQCRHIVVAPAAYTPAMPTRATWGCALLPALVACSAPAASVDPSLTPARETMPVADDADDPAIWLDRADPSRSLILGTNKVAAPRGALYVFDLHGQVRQTIGGLDRPNNVDVEYGLASPSGTLDIAVVTERLQHRLRVFAVGEQGLAPVDGGGIPVLEGHTGEARMPMGIALYRRPRDGAVFAIVAPKTGARSRYLWQYRLEVDNATGHVRGALVRRFGEFSGSGEIEAVAVDDELGYVYYADEEYAIRKWHADPDHPEADRELAVFGRDGFIRQREGIAIVSNPDGTGFIVCTNQIPGSSRLRLYPRQGVAGDPHLHEPAVATLVTHADGTDGIDAISTPLGDEFAAGLLVVMNSEGRNFQLYRWGDVQQLLVRAAR